MERLWGEVAPVPEENLHPLRGGEEVLGFRVAYTPGHASHHVSYLHPPTGRAFVGDTAAVRIPPSDFVMPPTPPPDIDLELWEDSIDRILDWEPTSLGLTHFGEVAIRRRHLSWCESGSASRRELARELSSEEFERRYPRAGRRARRSGDARRRCCRRCRRSSSGRASTATGRNAPTRAGKRHPRGDQAAAELGAGRQHGAIAAVPLRLVEGRVRAGEQLRPRTRRRPTGRCPAETVSSRGTQLAQRLDQSCAWKSVGRRQQDGELLAAVASDQIGGAEAARARARPPP